MSPAERSIDSEALEPRIAAPRLPLRLLLRFNDASVERHFHAHYLLVFYRYAQAGLGLGVALVLGDFLIDVAVHPGCNANFLRIELVIPLLLLTLAGSWLPGARRTTPRSAAG